jgi:hypothetical protein
MPIAQFYHGATVVFIQRKITGRDEYGNDLYDSCEQKVNDCTISPGTTTQDWQGTEQITADVTVYCPAGTKIDLPVDKMTTPDGVTYNVVGLPKNWASPFTGTQSFVEVLGRLVTTGGAAT